VRIIKLGNFRDNLDIYRQRPNLGLQGVKVEAISNFFLLENSFMATELKREK
jgi:hypothetical protein